jgi:hypothetical protein
VHQDKRHTRARDKKKNQKSKINTLRTSDGTGYQARGNRVVIRGANLDQQHPGRRQLARKHVSWETMTFCTATSRLAEIDEIKLHLMTDGG